MKVIFLDIDGVLNWAGTEDRISGFVGLCQERIRLLNKITDAHPDAKIVISSTWRKMFFTDAYQDFDGLVKLLHDRGVTGDIVDHTPVHFGERERGHEIREWIDDWESARASGEKVERFVVLDDSLEGMEGYAIAKSKWSPEEPERVFRDLRPNHVVSTWYGEDAKGYTEPAIEGGLREKHVEQAIAVLNGTLVPGPYDGSWELPECEICGGPATEGKRCEYDS